MMMFMMEWSSIHCRFFTTSAIGDGAIINKLLYCSKRTIEKEDI